MGNLKNRFNKEEQSQSPQAEFLIDVHKREEQLISRIYRLSYLLSDCKLEEEGAEQIKLILEDALAELDSLNENFPSQMKLSTIMFH